MGNFMLRRPCRIVVIVLSTSLTACPDSRMTCLSKNASNLIHPSYRVRVWNCGDLVKLRISSQAESSLPHLGVSCCVHVPDLAQG